MTRSLAYSSAPQKFHVCFVLFSPLPCTAPLCNIPSKHSTLSIESFLSLPLLLATMSAESPILNLPGELRNQIYDEVACSAVHVKLFEGRVVLPPLARTCRKIRTEMSGKYEADVIKRDVDVHAHVLNCNFEPLRKWLSAHENWSARFQGPVRGRVPRLKIFLILTSTEVIESSPHPKLRAGLLHQKLQLWQREWHYGPLQRVYMSLRDRRAHGLARPWEIKGAKCTRYWLCRRRGSGLHYALACHVRLMNTDHFKSFTLANNGRSYPTVEYHQSYPSFGSKIHNGFSYLDDFTSELLVKIHHDLTQMSPAQARGPMNTSTASTPIFDSLSMAYQESKDKKWNFAFCRKLNRKQWEVVETYRWLDVHAFERHKESSIQSVKRKQSPSDDHYLLCKKRFFNSPAAMRLAINDWAPSKGSKSELGRVAEAIGKVNIRRSSLQRTS